MKAKHVFCVVLPLVLVACLLSACAGLSLSSILGGGGNSANKTFGDWTYRTVGREAAQTITITGYIGAGGTAEMPAVIEELPVVAIAKDAFDKNVRLTGLTIPASVTVIADTVDKAEDAFDGATGLTSITVDEANSVYSSADGVLFNKAKTTLILCPEGKGGSYTIPSSVTVIADCALEDCAKLTSVIIPDSVTSIGELAFNNCTGLTSITIPGSVKTIGGRVNENLYGAFMGCTGLKTVTISEGVASIGGGAFAYCTNLPSVNIPDSVIYVGGNAFAACDKLTTVTVSPVNGRNWDVEIAGSRTSSGYGSYWAFQNSPLNNASKTALTNAGYPTEQGKF